MRPIDYDTAWTAAQDAANRRMREAGRNTWDEEDYDLAAREFSRIMPPEEE